MLRRGGSLLIADPANGRAVGCRAALTRELTKVGATRIVEEPLERLALPEDGVQQSEAGAEPLVLLRAEFEAAPE